MKAATALFIVSPDKRNLSARCDLALQPYHKMVPLTWAFGSRTIQNRHSERSIRAHRPPTLSRYRLCSEQAQHGSFGFLSPQLPPGTTAQSLYVLHDGSIN